MARPRKKGLDYIPLDVHFFDDRRVRKLNSKYKGGRASFVYLLLISEIAQDGFYIKLTEDDLRFLAHESGIQRKVFNQIIWDLIENEFFDKDLYEKYNVLTNEDIQKQYFSIKNSNSSLELTAVEAEYLLVDISRYKNVKLLSKPAESQPKDDDKPAETPRNTGEKLQENPTEADGKPQENQANSALKKSKVKKSKKESRENKSFSAENRRLTHPHFSEKDFERLKNEIIERFPEHLKPQTEQDLAKWLEDYSQLRQQLSAEQIEQIVSFGLSDKFWKQNINSLAYLLKVSRTDGVPIWKKLLTQVKAKNETGFPAQISNPQKVKTDVATI